MKENYVYIEKIESSDRLCTNLEQKDLKSFFKFLQFKTAIEDKSFILKIHK